ncbi:MAG: DUF1638 domain-containing protein [Spirochaetia bacterium]
MKLHVIVCNIMTREISLVAATCESTLNLHFMEQELHDRPDQLRKDLQAEIDSIDGDGGDGDADAIILAYGLCSNAICGLRSKYYPMVAPRAHDCMTLIVGSKERYQEYFDRHPGTYWYTPGWIEQTPVPGKERVERTRADYAAKFGEENADYLMEMEQEWLRTYSRCAYVAWPELHRDEYRSATRDSAVYLEWEFDEIVGDDGLMRRLLGGQWDGADVLVVPPGETIEPSYNRSIIQSTD